MGSIDQRLSDLEASLKAELKGSGPTETRRFILDYLLALKHVRRETLDLPGLRYEVGLLDDLSPWSVAGYVAALDTLEHPDRFEAREILTAKTDGHINGQSGCHLERLIDSAVSLAARSRGRRS
jgi:hypothetical protein